MKRSIVLSALVLAGLGVVNAQQNTQDPVRVKYAQTITQEELKEDLSIIASDALEGRGTGERGQKMAAAFIKQSFKENGLTGPVNGGYYQDVPLKAVKAGEMYIKTNGKSFKSGSDFLYSGTSNSTNEIIEDVVFAGTGSKKELAALDVEGKAVLIIQSDRRKRQFTSAAIKEQGAKALFAVPSASQDDFEKLAKRYAAYAKRERLSVDFGDKPQDGIGTFTISPDLAASILNTSFDNLVKKISKAETKPSILKKVKSGNVAYKLDFISRKVESENVLGFIEGTDLKNELIILTAHYDHIGISSDGQINNGADDDGSGVVAVLEMAEAFAQAKVDGNGPRRSILFMTVTGEEKGLLGSSYYAANPVFSLDNTVANLNIDMIGRAGERNYERRDYIYLIGADKISQELHDISDEANKTYINMHLDYTYNDEGHPQRYYYRSDHWNFAKNGIPVIFYFNGVHADYHKPTDTIEKIEFDLLQKRAQLVFYTAWELANKDKRLVIDEVTSDKN
ncbi:hypothetical protein KH5_16330 [Urechidicola sp. KH5]